jgi:hypothetical protein
MEVEKVMTIKNITLILMLLLPGIALANNDVMSLQKGWAVANYQLKGDAQEKAFDALVVKADVALNNNPTSADILIWRGIIKSSFAGVKGGLGALSLIKESKQDLEKALDINDKALSGSAYTSLGVLYFKAPGWPISFGDDKEAEKLLQTALQINQDGIDSNFFYAEFLRDQGDLVNAKVYLEKAKRAPARSNRPVADKGRQEDIAKALLEVKDALN